MLKKDVKSITAFAPATCSNIAVGFDILGFPITGVGDEVTLTLRDDNKIIIEKIIGNDNLPTDPYKNVASSVVMQLLKDHQITQGFSIIIKKGIPLGSGLGGSAASAVGALVALNAFFETPLSIYTLAKYALKGEAMVSGQPHGDNIIPCLFGGFTLIRNINPVEVETLPIPNLYCALIHPHIEIKTKDAREILRPDLPLKDFVKQSANLASFIAALFKNDLVLLEQSLKDVLIEPYRAQLIPGFYKAQDAAIKNGALGASLSGSGPTMFALTPDIRTAKQVTQAMKQIFTEHSIECDVWISPISSQTAKVLNNNEIYQYD